MLEKIITRGVFTPDDRLDRFSRNAQATNWIWRKKIWFVKTNLNV